MNRYWDLERQERAELTEEQVRAFLEVELMEKGVRKIDPPKLRDVEEIDLSATGFFAVEYDGKYSTKSETDLVFRDLESAAAFIALAPLETDYDYDVGSEHKYAKPMTGMAVKPVEMCAEHDVMNEKTNLTARKAAKEANATAQGEYDKACRAVREATSGVWDDWGECQEWAANIAAVNATFEEYTSRTGNDSQALYFLLKAYDEDVIKDALGEERFTAMAADLPADEETDEEAAAA